MTSLPAEHATGMFSPSAGDGKSKSPMTAALKRLRERAGAVDYLERDNPPHEVDIRFGPAHAQTIVEDSMTSIGDLLVLPGPHGLTIEPADEGHGDRHPDSYALTGRKGKDNDHYLLFRHSYRKITCHLSMDDLSQVVHIGFLRYRDFKEIRAFTFDFTKSGAKIDPQESVALPLTYNAPDPVELQGIAWRGGSLRIERIRLTP